MAPPVPPIASPTQPAAAPTRARHTSAAAIRTWPIDRPLAAFGDASIPHEAHGATVGATVEGAQAPFLAVEPLRQTEQRFTRASAGETLVALKPPAHPSIPAADWLAAVPYDLASAFDAAFPMPPDTAVLWDALPTKGTSSSPPPPTGEEADPSRTPYHLHLDQLTTNRRAYERAVARAISYIRAGDVFQVNLAHALTGRFAGSARGLFADLLEHASPRHAAYLERSGLAVLSISPELFLSLDGPTGAVRTRPMKGTRPRTGSAEELLLAPKDRAELAMIVDLMRNDLGRSCRFGSVRVTHPRDIETHGGHAGGVFQATATVEGVLREGLTRADLLAGALPPGSITGAPKIRATEIIAELEPDLGLASRGYYTGAIGRFDGAGTGGGGLDLNVAIRTITIEGEPGETPGTFKDAKLTLPVGAGIVADSDPEAEFLETLDKARFLTSLPTIRVRS